MCPTIKVKHTFIRAQVFAADPFHNPIVRNLYNEWLEYPGSEKAIKYMHTEYHPIQKNVTGQIHNWWQEFTFAAADRCLRRSGRYLSQLGNSTAQ